MTDATARFFEDLQSRGHESCLERVKGTARFDVTHDGEAEQWLVQIVKGDVRVSREGGEADCVIRTSRTLLNDLTSGRVNAMAELLRGGLVIEGDPELLVMIQKLLPGARSDAPAGAGNRGGAS
jgi:predicted lipid carrier protein YhbT